MLCILFHENDKNAFSVKNSVVEECKREEPVCSSNLVNEPLVRKRVKAMETPIAEIRAFLDSESGDVQEALPGLIIQEDESGWELHPCGDKRVICLSSEDRKSPFYHP